VGIAAPWPREFGHDRLSFQTVRRTQPASAFSPFVKETFCNAAFSVVDPSPRAPFVSLTYRKGALFKANRFKLLVPLLIPNTKTFPDSFAGIAFFLLLLPFFLMVRFPEIPHALILIREDFPRFHDLDPLPEDRQSF